MLCKLTKLCSTYSIYMFYGVFVAGDLADLIFVFFDPMGQALCKRTLNIVGMLSSDSKNSCQLVGILLSLILFLFCRGTESQTP